MNRHRWFPALLILLALGGCAATGAGRTGYTPYSHDGHANLRGSGGADGGGM